MIFYIFILWAVLCVAAHNVFYFHSKCANTIQSLLSVLPLLNTNARDFWIASHCMHALSRQNWTASYNVHLWKKHPLYIWEKTFFFFMNLSLPRFYRVHDEGGHYRNFFQTCFQKIAAQNILGKCTQILNLTQKQCTPNFSRKWRDFLEDDVPS